jgi:hypothetical protein
MATTYTMHVQTLEGGIGSWSDTFTELRGELEFLEKSEEFNLGPRVASKKADDWDLYGGTRYYYYHNGRITVTTRYHQLTTGQRTGARSYSTPAAVIRHQADLSGGTK